MDKLNILFLAGSPNEDCCSRFLFSQIATSYQDKINVTACAPLQLPIFTNNRDYRKCPQSEMLEHLITKADAVVIASPSHNDTISCYLKNIIDHTSMPRGSNFWYQKPVGVIAFAEYMHNSAHSRDDLLHLLQYIGADVCTEPAVNFCRSRNIPGSDGEILQILDQILVSDLMDNVLQKAAAHKATRYCKPEHEISLWNSWY
ncbi:NAD(P)H-dependent oxidoreductase [Rheinheimera texasensis]|uniref:NAD(P)H-dependent oxidoreductase n=1 Tax=Rheinheimera texasensis TaxID=306205 RepID=UPI0032B2F789